MRFESERGQNEENWKKKNMFWNSKKLPFFLSLFFGQSFGFAFQRWFVELEKAFL